MTELLFLMLIQTNCGPAAPLSTDELATYETCRKNVAVCVAASGGSAQCVGRKYQEWLKSTKNLGEL